MSAIYQQLGALQAAGLTHHYANKIRRRVTCPNVVPLRLRYGSSGFIGAFHRDLRLKRVTDTLSLYAAVEH